MNSVLRMIRRSALPAFWRLDDLGPIQSSSSGQPKGAKVFSGPARAQDVQPASTPLARNFPGDVQDAVLPAFRQRDDDLGTARGMTNAILVGLLIWIAIVGLLLVLFG